MRQIQDLSFLRTRFDKINNYYGKQRGLPPSSSIIRIEEKLVNGQGVYIINLKKENLTSWEQNMKRNDLFVCTHLGIFLSVQDTTKPGVAPLLAYALKGTGVVNGFAATDIDALYSGTLNIMTGNVENIKNMPLALFKKVPEKQPSVLALDDGNGNVTGDLSQPTFDFLEMMHPMAEELTFAGTQDHKIRVEFPTFPASNYAGAGQNLETKLVFVALGYGVTNGTGEDFKNDAANPYRGAI